MRPLRCLVLTSVLFPFAVAAQDVGEFQVWNAAFATAHLGKQAPAVAFWLDVHVRRGNAGTVQLTRPGIGLQVTPWFSAWAGYAWVPVFSDTSLDPVNEHRAWQQVLFSHETSFRLSLQSRTRFEQRFSEAGPDVGFRLREFVRAAWLPSSGVPVGVVISDELFVGLNATSWGAPAGIDQNRLFLGPYFQLAPWGRIEAGYLFAYLERGSADRSQHALAVNLFLSPKFARSTEQ